MRVEINADDIDYSTGRGLEIYVKGFKGNPANAEEQDSQVFIESYDGKIRIHVWNDTFDPVSFELIERESK